MFQASWDFVLIMGSVEILFLSSDLVKFFDNYESDPLSPPEGEATQGGRPLYPRQNFH
jgi:hypothetical protein